MFGRLVCVLFSGRERRIEKDLRSETMIDFKKTAKCLFKNNRANVSLIFAVAAIPTVLATGVAVDYSRLSSMKATVQSALDDSALAAASSTGLADSERIVLATNLFTKNLETEIANGYTFAPVVTISEDKVTMSADVSVPMTLMKLGGINSFEFSTQTQINIPADKKAEIALVLDYSGSMSSTSGGQVKYIAMRDAAIGLVSGLSAGQSADRVKFGLVPFSHHVQVSLPGDYVVGGTPGTTWTGCTQDRKYPYNTSDSTPISGNDDTKWGHPHASVHSVWGCAGYIPNNLVVKPISNDHSGVINQLNAMTPYAWTHIALGFEYGWHLVSDTAPFTNVAANNDSETQKYIILLTDGAQTEPAFGPAGTRTVAKGEQNLEALCSAAKAQNIIVVTVAFDLNSPATENRLSNCSTDPAKHFFIAEDGAALATVFEQIKAEITAQVFISR
jgi:Flp pilus assembly protein TadG